LIYALLFELGSIQEYLFISGRLRDVSGASEMLDRLTNAKADDNLLDAVCQALGVKIRVDGAPEAGEITFSRRSGGAFYAFSQDAGMLTRLRGLWTLALQQVAPYLSYNLGKGGGDDPAEAFQAARKALRADASRLRPALPLAAPVAERSRRTGFPAVSFGQGKDGALDAAGVQRKRFADLARTSPLSSHAVEQLRLLNGLYPDGEPQPGQFIKIVK